MLERKKSKEKPDLGDLDLYDKLYPVADKLLWGKALRFPGSAPEHGKERRWEGR